MGAFRCMLPQKNLKIYVLQDAVWCNLNAKIQQIAAFHCGQQSQRKNLSNILSLLRAEAESSLTAGTTRSNFTRLKLPRNNQQLHWGVSQIHHHASFNPRSVSEYALSCALRVCNCCSNQLLSRSCKYILSCFIVTFSQVKFKILQDFDFFPRSPISFTNS